VRAMATEEKSRIGLCGLAVMGQVRFHADSRPSHPCVTPSILSSGDWRRFAFVATRLLRISSRFFSDASSDARGTRRTLDTQTPNLPPQYTPPLPTRHQQNLALNVAEKGFKISVYNRSGDKTDNAVARAEKEGLSANFAGYKDMGEFVQSLAKPRTVIILVKAGAPVDATIAGLSQHMEPGDIIIDGGNEWYENTERRQKEATAKGLLYLGMGVSGGEEGARNGPAMMPGGDRAAFDAVEEVVVKVCAQTDSGPCVTYVGPGGAGNFVKMIHNGIEYGDMQLISEAYDVLRTVGGLTNDELVAAFDEWNANELDSFLIEISALILAKQDDQKPDGGALVDKILDKTGMKGTGKWTVQQAAELSVAIPTIASSLDARFLSGLKDERVAAEKVYAGVGLAPADTKAPSLSPEEKQALVDDVRAALYASKICSYAQGMNLIRAKSVEQGWDLDLGEMARIWKGGCIIRARFLDRIKQAYDKDPNIPSLLVDGEFAKELVARNDGWRRVIVAGVNAGVATPSMSGSLNYFDSYRRGRLPANLVQAQRDFFGSHTYERIDMEGWHHTVWSDMNSADSITTSGYNN
jgi:6-phosphogluconate dehydrogenase